MSPIAKFKYMLGRGFMIHRVLYKYWLHGRVTWEIFTPRKTIVNVEKGETI